MAYNTCVLIIAMIIHRWGDSNKGSNDRSYAIMQNMPSKRETTGLPDSED